MERIKVLERLARESDHAVLHAIEHLHERLAAANELDVSTLLGDLPAEPATREAVGHLADDATAHYDRALSDAESVRFARDYLVALTAVDDASRRLVAESLSSWVDERQTVGKVLARGVVVSLLLIAMSTSVKYEGESLTIEKQTLSAEQMRAFGEVALSLVTRLGVGRGDSESSGDAR